MAFYYHTLLHNTSYDEAIERVTGELKKEGFGVLTKIDMRETLKQKIDADFRKYIILGACNPRFAHKALLIEGKIGVFLPCNVVVEEHEDGTVEVTAVDPVTMMAFAETKEVESLAAEVQESIKRVITAMGSLD